MPKSLATDRWAWSMMTCVCHPLLFSWISFLSVLCSHWGARRCPEGKCSSHMPMIPSRQDVTVSSTRLSPAWHNARRMTVSTVSVLHLSAALPTKTFPKINGSSQKRYVLIFPSILSPLSWLPILLAGRSLPQAACWERLEGGSRASEVGYNWGRTQAMSRHSYQNHGVKLSLVWIVAFLTLSCGCINCNRLWIIASSTLRELWDFDYTNV